MLSEERARDKEGLGMNKLKSKLKRVREILKAARLRHANLHRRHSLLKARLSGVFGKDQIESLCVKRVRGVVWSNETVKKALQIRFSCGSSGYNNLLRHGLPFPSLRTLQRRMENINFEPGILHQVFHLLSCKVEHLGEEERLCCLTLDEMSLSPGIEFDRGTGKVVGGVTLADHSGRATHGLVFVLGGLCSRWKQVVAYDFTGNATNGSAFKPIVLKIIECAEEIGLRVTTVTSDMGSANRAMWKVFGISATKDSGVRNKIDHPYEAGQKLYFLADVPYVIKNLKAALVNGNKVILPDDVVSDNMLSHNVVSLEPVKDLLQFQSKHDLKLAPKLTSATLNPSHFQKMKVSNALNLLSKSVSSGIRFLVEKEGRPSPYLTTAWFIDTCNHWFDLMSSRHAIMALSRRREDEHKAAISFLHFVIRLFQHVKIGEKGTWKPVQTGVVLSTTSVIELQKELFDRGFGFLLTARLTQDCVENLFSIVRSKNPTPSSLAFKRALKIISISQFLKPVSRHENHEDDDREYAIDFIGERGEKGSEDISDLPTNDLSNTENPDDLSEAEQNSLYYIAGYCVNSIKREGKHAIRVLLKLNRVNHLEQQH